MRKILSFIIVCLLAVFIAPCVCAQDNSQSDFNAVKERIDQSFRSALDESTKKVLEEEKISLSNPKSITDIKADNVFERLWEYFKIKVKNPFLILRKILAVTIICAVIKHMNTSKDLLGELFETLCVVTVITVIANSLSESFGIIKSSIESINTFMISYIPIFAGVVTAGGGAVTAGSYTGIMLTVCEIMGTVASKILVPFLSSVLAVTLISAINPRLKFTSIAGSIKKCTIWILGGVMSIFVALMSIQGLTGNAADTLSSKAVKFAASSFIPVIGSSVSDAYSAVKGSLSLIKSGVGSIGIIIVFIIVIKPVIAVLAIKLAIWIGKVVSEIFGESRTAKFLENVNSVLSIGLSIIIFYGVVFIIATNMVMLTALSVGV